MTENIVAVEDYKEAAGAIVWWDLTGTVDFMELEEAWLDLGCAEATLPAIPGVEICLQRAASNATRSNRELVRPLRRGAWDVVIEHLVLGDNNSERLEHETAVRLRVRKDADGHKSPEVTAVDPKFEALAQRIRDAYSACRGTLVASDISSWLLWLLKVEVQAVSLRDRGGFYFVPADRIQLWKGISTVLHQVSGHTVSEIPAMRADDTVAAVLMAVRKEAEAAMAEMEEYLGGDISTKGLNATERRTAEVAAKVQRYADLLGVALPELQNRASTLLGAVRAARFAATEGEA